MVSHDVTSVSVLTNHHIDTSYYDIFAVELARDAVKTHNQDYYFFQYDDDEYVLILSHDMTTENGFDCSAHDVTCIVFQRIDTTYTEHDSMTISGTITEVGAPPRVDDVALSGSVSHSDSQTSWKTYLVIGDGVHVYNSEYTVYSDCCPYMPKLREGVDYYAVAAFILAGIIISFKLADRIFRRVY